MFPHIGFAGVIDIAILTSLVYIVLVWFKRSRAAFVLTGIVIIGVIYLLAQTFNLELTSGILQGFFAVILIAFVVIFQEEIRRFFEQIALWSISPHLRKKKKPVTLLGEEVETLVRTVGDLARDRIGALIVIRGKNMLLGHLDGGIELGGRLSESLLKSLFDPHSAGHDGAVIVEFGRVTQFGAHLPLSKNYRSKEHSGTRHAAAVGITEITDALSVVVSEEKGTVSVARNGEMKKMDSAAVLLATIERFYRDIRPPKERTLRGYVTRNLKEKIVALLLAIGLWFVQVHGSQVVYKTFEVPVDYALLPTSMTIVESRPKSVEVTFSGPRRSLYFAGSDDIKLFLKTLNVKPGAQTLRISASDFSFPQDIKLENIAPRQVMVEVEGKDNNP